MISWIAETVKIAIGLASVTAGVGLLAWWLIERRSCCGGECCD